MLKAPSSAAAPQRLPRYPRVGVGVILFKGAEVLLVKRTRGEKAGEWSIPGGHVEWGEPLQRAALRELAEETGIRLARLGGLVDAVDLIEDGPDGKARVHYVLVDFWAVVAPRAAARARAMSDAAALAWVPLSRLDTVAMWEKTRAVIHKAAAMAGLPAAGAAAGERTGR